MWDERYGDADYVYGTQPNDFLAERATVFPAGGRILCLAEGEGRNAVFLASRGHAVTGVDSSAVGLVKADKLAEERGVKIETVVADLMEYDMGEMQWDGIVGIFCHLPPPVRAKVLGRITRALKPGGVFFLEAYTPAQLELKTGGPPVAEMMYTLDCLRKELPAGLTEEHAEEITRAVVEGKFHIGEAAVVQYIARRSPSVS